MRSKPPPYTRSPVRRIVVDEALEPTVVRLLVAGLKDGVKEFAPAALEPWQEEQELVITPDDFQTVLGTSRDPRLQARAVEEVVGKTKAKLRPKDVLWRGLREGQVFLVGAFEVAAGTRLKPKTIRVRQGAREFLRIDQAPAVKQAAKQLYAEALGGRRENHA